MLFSAISFFLWIPAILGIGDIGHIPYRIWMDKNIRGTIIENAILGMALISAIANWVNLSFSISNLVQISIMLLGWGRFLYILYRKEFKKTSTKIMFWAIILGLGLSFLRANVAPSHHDSGLYGLQNVLWYNTMPLPFGLANLHGRLAYNSSWLALASVIQFPTADFFFNGELLLWFISFILLFSIEASIKGEWSPSIIYGLATSLVFLTPVLGTFNISSLATDYPVFWLSITSGWVSLRLLERKTHPLYALWFTIIIFVWGITLKLSAFPLFFIVVSQFIVENKNIRYFWKPILKSISPFVFFILVPWVARFFLMSGCLLYPITFTCIPELKWSVPISSVKWMKDHIQQFAINHTITPVKIPSLWFTDKILLQEWQNRYFSYSETWALFFFVGLGIVIYLIPQKEKEDNRNHRNEIILMLAYVIGIILWFITAPSIRFGSGYIWVVALLLLSLGGYYALQGKNLKIKRLTSTFISILLFGLLIFSVARRVVFLLGEDYRINWVTPDQAPVVESYSRNTDGVDVHYPVKNDLLCWGEPLPCALEPNLDLRIEKDKTGQVSMFYLEVDN